MWGSVGRFFPVFSDYFLEGFFRGYFPGEFLQDTRHNGRQSTNKLRHADNIPFSGHRSPGLGFPERVISHSFAPKAAALLC